MRQKQVGLILLILAVAGCSTPVSPTPLPTEAGVPVVLSPTLTPKSIITSTATLFPATSTPTQTHTPIPAEPQPISFKPSAIIAKIEGGTKSFLLLGGNQNGNWVSAADVAGVIAIDSEFKIYTAYEFQDWIPVQELRHEPFCNQYYISLDPTSTDQSAVGVAGDWPVLPRTPQEIPLDTEIYLQAVAAWQVEQAPSQPIAAINKIWKVDIEGNGTDEVFISATRFAEPTGHNVEPRDYSVVLMRTVIGPEVVTVKLVGDYYSEAVENRFPLTYKLEFIGDLNADGQMEVVVGVSRWEGMGVMVFEVDGDEVQLVLSVMCSQ